MKHTIAFIIILLIIAALILCGCSDGRTVQHDWDRLMRIEQYNDYGVYADTETGVEYLVYNHANWFGITPVLNADGAPVLAPNFDAREDRLPND